MLWINALTCVACGLSCCGLLPHSSAETPIRQDSASPAVVNPNPSKHGPSTGYLDVTPVNLRWEFQRDNDASWIPALVPAPWESFLGTTFDGSGTYRFVLDREESAAVAKQKQELERQYGPLELYVVFDGVATDAKVTLNGQVVGSHLGPWTPWSCQIDDQWLDAESNEMKVWVDEKVGHHTQGFLPVFLPHFGGIWQPVRWELRPAARVHVDQALVLGHFSDDGAHWIDIELPVSHAVQPGHQILIRVQPPQRVVEHQVNPTGNDIVPQWQVAEDHPPIDVRLNVTTEHIAAKKIRTRLAMPSALAWTPQTPWLYPVQVNLFADETSTDPLHTATFRTGIRRYETRGHQILLNGQPIIIQGALNWGYAPPSVAPSLQAADMLQELLAARRMGLNLMKFCLWIPPKRYLELSDEMGMLTWIEYPTWHAQLIDSNLEELSREYTEFTNFDRNHPSVVLRSLTCETGPSAHLSVIQHLYDLVHRQVPGAIVEDDSSWISWNRISDIWDDHPYGNNHTWVPTLARLRDFIAQREAKPLVLGEAIAADTWPDLQKMSQRGEEFLRLHHLETRPVWYFGFLEAAIEFDAELRQRGHDATLQRLKPDSIEYAFLMRKFQIETYRREVPWGGYILSVIRDFPFAAMGLLDTWGQNKFPTWDIDQKFHAADTMVLVETPADRRSWFSEQQATMDLLLATPHDLPIGEEHGLPASVQWQLMQVSNPSADPSAVPSGEITFSDGRVDWGLWRPENLSATANDHPRLPLSIQMPTVSSPTQVVLRVTVDVPEQTHLESKNAWTFWVFPIPSHPEEPVQLVADKTLSKGHQEWFDQPFFDQRIGWVTQDVADDQGPIILASRFHIDLLDQLEAGATVLMFPDGGERSLPTQGHWFLRGGPLLFSHPILGLQSDEFAAHAQAVAQLQHFDLAGDTQPQFTYWSQSSPVVALWDNHDIKEVRVHGLLWEAKVGSGRLLVSLLNHDPKHSAAGPYFLARCLEHLHSDFQPKPWDDGLVTRLRVDLVGQDINLTTIPWRLQPDPEVIGMEQGWADPQHDTSQWRPIRIDAHWEGQGFAALDGWAWYAAELEIPREWNGQSLYLCFTGVDDHYQAFVNGEKIGEAGVIETKETAFEMRTSHLLPASVKAGDRISIRVAVYDWYGAGGIFRPVYLRTTPWSDTAPLLKR